MSQDKDSHIWPRKEHIVKNSDMLDNITLYDVMYEAGTRLGSMYAAYQRRALEKGDAKTANKWLQKGINLQRKRRKISPANRQEMIDAYDRWGKEESKLYAAFNTEKAYA